MERVEGAWLVDTDRRADVRLRSGRIGLMSVDVTAPVSAGELHVRADGVRLTLTLALDRLKANFILQNAARSLVTRHDARELRYDGLGASPEHPWQVNGAAVCGDIEVELVLTVTPRGDAADPMAAIELAGTANVGTVHLPLPGLGTVDDFTFDVDARLSLRVQPV